MSDVAEPRPPPDETPIGRHGVIGDLETLALIGREATVEWLCWPRFDSPAVFGRLLDADGGHWRIAPRRPDRTVARRLYLPGTNILITRYHVQADGAMGVVEIEDCMAIDAPQRMLVRRVRGVRGTVPMRLDLVARPDYGRRPAELSAGDRSARIGWSDGRGEQSLVLSASVPVEVDGDALVAEFVVEEGDRIVFALGPEPWDCDRGGNTVVDATTSFWRAWIGKSTYRGRWREIVERSALTLKLLTHRPTGGLIAAGTTSLPETVGGSRNWDYRYVWIRDAAFVLYAFMELGFTDEAEAFTDWLQARVHECSRDGSPPLRPLYDLDGNAEIPEIELDHWSGHLDSSPVRIGNAASDQLQLDIYGEIVDSLYLADKYGRGLSLDAWDDVRAIVDWVCANWDQPDDGFWEVRNGPWDFTAARLFSWVALERAIRMATSRGRPADLERWRRTRDEIHRCILERGWNDDLQSFTQTLDGDGLDAALLLMPLVKFVSPHDPRWSSTLDAIDRTLAHDVLVERYEDGTDGMDGDEGSFTICSFWFVEALARAGRVDEAQLHFDKLLTYAGPLGLFSETISDAGVQLGNFPQAFTHLALISAAVSIEEALADG